MEVVSIFNSVKCITLIFGLFTGNIQTTDSILVDRDKGHDFHATKKKKQKKIRHIHSYFTVLGHFRDFRFSFLASPFFYQLGLPRQRS